MIKRPLERFCSIDGDLVLLGVASTVIGIIGWIVLAAIASDVPIARTPILWSSIIGLVVAYIGSAFYGADDRAEQKMALLVGTVGLPGLLVALLAVAVIRSFIWLLDPLLRFSDILVNVQQFIGGGGIKKYQAWREQKQEEKEQKRKQKEQAKIRIQLANKTAYRSPAPNCITCGQDLPMYDETTNETTTKEMTL